MEESKKGGVMTAEALVGRFRSKEDLHKYLTLHCTNSPSLNIIRIGNIFLPSLKGTRVSFLRDILNEQKLHLKSSEVIHLEVPQYQEISVQNMYDDAMGDDQLKRYLPSRDQLSNRLPERRFFFGVLSTLKRQYLTDIIASAHAHRYKAEEGSQKKEGILVSDHWQAELVKHPFYSKKKGTAIFLMKERAKLKKDHSARSQFVVAKRLSSQISGASDMMMSQPKPEKRVKGNPTIIQTAVGQMR